MNGLNANAEVIQRILKDDGTYPNNDNLPLLLYKDVLNLLKGYPAKTIDELFENNNWGGSWVNGIYSFHHYHSTAHEVLGCFSGSAKVQLGGEDGIIQTIGQGDVVVIPAGVSHKNLGSSSDFRVVGAYPFGQSPDMCRGGSKERPKADKNIASVNLPEKDPVFGELGPIIDQWTQKT